MCIFWKQETETLHGTLTICLGMTYLWLLQSLRICVLYLFCIYIHSTEPGSKILTHHNNTVGSSQHRGQELRLLTNRGVTQEQCDLAGAPHASVRGLSEIPTLQ